MTEDDRAAAPDFLAGGGEVGALMRAHDWSSTPFGPPETWPQSLRSAASICLGTNFPIAIYWGPELALLYNDAWSPIPGEKHPWALGRPGRDVWPEIWNAIGPLFDKVQTTGEGVWQQDQLLPMHRHGYTEECYFNFTFSPIRGEQGRIDGIFNAVVETTFQVIGERRERTLRELSERIAAARSEGDVCTIAAQTFAARSADVPFCLVYLLDPDGRQARLAGLAGLAPGGPAAPEAIDAGAAASPWPLRRVVETGRAERVDDLITRFGSAPPGGPWPEPAQSALVAPIAATAHAGAVAGFLVAGISPRRMLDDDYRAFIERAAAHVAATLANVRAYDEERRRAEALAAIDRAKTAFFSNVSHEFRTPLTLMLGPLEEALSRSGGDDAIRPLVDVAHRNGLRLLKLVNSLLDFSRIEAGRVRASYEPTDLAAFTAELASSFRSAVDKAGLRLAVACPALAAPVFVDRDMWEKIVLNLLSNAFKFTFEGEIGVEIQTSADGRSAVLRVRDTGTGIPAHELPRLFERFHRVEGARGRTFEGSGIGLALVQELVSLHGGTIAVESEPDRGSTFIVTVPFGTAHLPADRIDGERTPVATGVRAQAYVEEALRWLPSQEGAGSSEGETPSRSAADDLGAPRQASGGAGGHVLLADDNTDMRDYVHRLLVERGYEVEAVADGEAALAAARRQKPDLVLSDVMMPRLDGFGLLNALRGDAALGDVPVVLLSARAGEEARVEGLDAGADDYLTKPFSARELIGRVGANLALSRVRRNAIAALRESEERTRELFQQAPGFVCVLRGPAHVFEFANQSYRRLIGDRELIGKPVREVFPEIEGQGFFEVLETVYRTGEPFAGHATPVRLRRTPGGAMERVFLDFIYQPITGANGEVTGVFVEGFDVTDRVEAQEAFARVAARSERQRRLYEAILTNTPDLAYVFDLDHRFIYANEGLLRMWGRTWDDAIGKNCLELGYEPWHAALHDREIEQVIATKQPVRGEVPFTGTFGRRIYDYIFVPVIGPGGEVEAVAGTTRDVTERKQQEEALHELNDTLEHKVEERTRALKAEAAERENAEEALRQAQKMEAIGQLTGGVAHDFNNILHVIQANLELLGREADAAPRIDTDQVARPVRAALRGVERAAALTQRLLAFARRQPLAPEPLDANKLVAGMSDLLRRTLGESIAIETVLAGGLWRSFADPNQLESALLNLAVNARDAMPDGGRLVVETANTRLDDAYAGANQEVTPGDYVMIAVTDTGCGMPKDAVERAFEPFFTTKEVGKGTGLGLSQVYGFVKQSGGHVKIYSESGEGTTVRLYLPRHLLQGEERQDAPVAPAVPRAAAGETILVVEDDADVRATSVESLRALGYRVLAAPDGPAALRLLDADPSIRLLFTDVGLPGGMNGRRVAEEARRRRPGLRVLFTTGYARDAIVHNGRLDPGVQFVGKPYTYAALAAKIRAALHEEG